MSDDWWVDNLDREPYENINVWNSLWKIDRKCVTINEKDGKV